MMWVLGDLVRGARILAIEDRPDLDGHTVTLSNGRVWLVHHGEQFLLSDTDVQQ